MELDEESRMPPAWSYFELHPHHSRQPPPLCMWAKKHKLKTHPQNIWIKNVGIRKQKRTHNTQQAEKTNKLANQKLGTWEGSEIDWATCKGWTHYFMPRESYRGWRDWEHDLAFCTSLCGWMALLFWLPQYKTQNCIRYPPTYRC